MPRETWSWADYKRQFPKKSPERAPKQREHVLPQHEVRPGSTSPGAEQQCNTMGVTAGETAPPSTVPTYPVSSGGAGKKAGDLRETAAMAGTAPTRAAHAKRGRESVGGNEGQSSAAAPEAGGTSKPPASGSLDYCAFGCPKKTQITTLGTQLQGDRLRARVRCGCPKARTWIRILVRGGRG